MSLGLAVLLLYIVKTLKGFENERRLSKIGYNPESAIVPRLNLVLLLAAGVLMNGLQLIADLVGFFNFDIGGFKLFWIPIAIGWLLLLADLFDGNGIKPRSYKIAFMIGLMTGALSGKVGIAIRDFIQTPNDAIIHFFHDWIG